MALGAALAPYLDNRGKLPNKPMRHGYWGPSFEDEAIETALRTYKLRYVKLADPARAAAELLTQGNILGWFQGRMECGPRALGSRSILADPRDPEMNVKGQQCGEIPRMVEAVCTFPKEGNGERIPEERHALVIGSFLVEK